MQLQYCYAMYYNLFSLTISDSFAQRMNKIAALTASFKFLINMANTKLNFLNNNILLEERVIPLEIELLNVFASATATAKECNEKEKDQNAKKENDVTHKAKIEYFYKLLNQLIVNIHVQGWNNSNVVRFMLLFVMVKSVT